MSTVCGTDYSERADESVAAAATFAKHIEEPLSLVHADTISDAARARLRTGTECAYLLYLYAE